MTCTLRLLTAILSGLTILFLTRDVNAQDTLQSNIGFGMGYAFQALKSELFSPMVHTGPSLAMQIYYRTEGPRSRQHYQITYDSYSLISPVHGLSTEGDQGLIQAAYHRLLSKQANQTRFYLGGVFDVHFSYRYNNPSIGNNQTGEIISSLSPSIMMEIDLGRSRLIAQTWVSLLAFVLQPGYAQSYPQDKYFTSFGNLFRAQARVSYVWPMGNRLEGRLDWQFIYFDLHKYEEIRFVNMETVLSIAYKFRKK